MPRAALVRVIHGVENLPENTKAAGDGQPMLVAIAIDVLRIDVFVLTDVLMMVSALATNANSGSANAATLKIAIPCLLRPCCKFGATSATIYMNGMAVKPITSDSGFDPEQITIWLDAWKAGDTAALDGLVSASYPKLHQLAENMLRRELHKHTLQATGLVNELYLLLKQQRIIKTADREQFYAFSAYLIRLILLNRARDRRAAKRGNGIAAVPLSDHLPGVDAAGDDMIDVHRAFEELAALECAESAAAEHDRFPGVFSGRGGDSQYFPRHRRARSALCPGVGARAARRAWREAGRVTASRQNRETGWRSSFNRFSVGPCGRCTRIAAA